MRTQPRFTLRSSDQAGGGIAVGGSLIVALLFASPERVFAQAPTLQLQASNYNGYNISCFGVRDGSIDLTVTGGVAPYTYDWSNGATTQDVSGLASGFYSVRVTGANNIGARADLTLTEPLQLKGEASVFMYPNGYNVSCYQCFNGSIAVLPFDGVAPYGYAWMDGSTTQNRSNLGAVQTSVTITDANACEWRSEIFTLTSPERSDWTMSGNAGTNPTTQYIGTTDNKDLVFRTQGTERLRLKANGELKVANLQFNGGYSLLFADSTGTLRSADGSANEIQGLKKPCPVPWPWLVCGNNINPDQWLGTKNNEDLIIRTNNVVRMRVDKHGKVGIGATPPTNSSSNYQLYVEGGIMARECRVTVSTFFDTVFLPGYHLLSLKEYAAFIKENGHLPHIPAAQDLRTADGYGIDLGDMQMRLLRTVEEQALYIVQLEQRLAGIEARLNAQPIGK